MKCIGCHKRKKTDEHGVCSKCQQEMDEYITYLLGVSFIFSAVDEFKSMLERDIGILQKEISTRKGL